MPLPYKEGVHAPQELAIDGAPALLGRLSSATKLSDLQDQFMFFTHGALRTYGGLDFDPVQDAVNEFKGDDLEPAHFDMPSPIFSNLWMPTMSPEFSAYNYRLICCEHRHWQYLEQRIGSIMAVDRMAGRLIRTTAQKVKIIDVLAMDRLAVLPSTIPMIEIVAFGVDSNELNVVFEDASYSDNKLSPARVRRVAVNQSTLQMAGAMKLRQALATR